MRGWLRYLLAGSAALLAACSTGGEVTLETSDISEAGFLGATVDRTTEEGFNFSMVMDISMVIPNAPMGSIQADDVAFASGQVDGDLTRTAMNLRDLMEAMAPGGFLPEQLDQFQMEMIADAAKGEAFMRAPMFALMAGQPGVPEMGNLAEISDRWGRIDLSALGDVLPSEAIAQLTGGAVGFEAILDLVRNAENAQEAAPSTIRGVEATGVSAELTFDDLLSLSGMSLDNLPGLSAAPDAAAIVDAMRTVTVPITVWLDDAARIVRVEFIMDFAPVFDQLASTTGERVPEGMEFSQGYTMDAFDFGDPDPITKPDDWIDVTDSYRTFIAATISQQQ